MKKTKTKTIPFDRSAIMRAVRSRDTGPELLVRQIARSISPGYRLDRKDIPGRPDIAYVSRKLAIFVHGCFWHGHDCARGARLPKTNSEYWKNKIARNVRRDKQNDDRLAQLGWRSLVIWECELRDIDRVRARLERLLSA